MDIMYIEMMKMIKTKTEGDRAYRWLDMQSRETAKVTNSHHMQPGTRTGLCCRTRGDWPADCTVRGGTADDAIYKRLSRSETGVTLAPDARQRAIWFDEEGELAIMHRGAETAVIACARMSWCVCKLTVDCL